MYICICNIYIYIHVYVFLHIYIYLCVCACHNYVCTAVIAVVAGIPAVVAMPLFFPQGFRKLPVSELCD